MSEKHQNCNIKGYEMPREEFEKQAIGQPFKTEIERIVAQLREAACCKESGRCERIKKEQDDSCRDAILRREAAFIIEELWDKIQNFPLAGNYEDWWKHAMQEARDDLREERENILSAIDDMDRWLSQGIGGLNLMMASANYIGKVLAKMKTVTFDDKLYPDSKP